MVSIKKAHWQISIVKRFGARGQYYWQAYTPDHFNDNDGSDCGVQYIFQFPYSHKRRDAVEHWKQFAQINEINNWKFTK
jgi:hypothetical protein